MYCLGLDIASLNSGYCILDEKAEPVSQGVWSAPAKLDYLERGSFQAEGLMELINMYPPSIICIEGYSLGSVGNKEALISVGTIIRYFLRQLGYAWVTVAPTQIKKYCHAKEKKMIIKEVYKRWGFDTDSDDIADAYVLARIGL